MPDARCTRDLVCNVHKKVRTRAYRAAENIRHSLRNGFTAYNELSPVNGSFATVISGTYRRLDTSTEVSGPHVFAVRSRTVRYRHYQRPPQPVPRSRTIMTRPSDRDGMARDIPQFALLEKRNIFYFGA